MSGFSIWIPISLGPISEIIVKHEHRNTCFGISWYFTLINLHGKATGCYKTTVHTENIVGSDASVFNRPCLHVSGLALWALVLVSPGFLPAGEMSPGESRCLWSQPRHRLQSVCGVQWPAEIFHIKSGLCNMPSFTLWATNYNWRHESQIWSVLSHWCNDSPSRQRFSCLCRPAGQKQRRPNALCPPLGALCQAHPTNTGWTHSTWRHCVCSWIKQMAVCVRGPLWPCRQWAVKPGGDHALTWYGLLY